MPGRQLNNPDVFVSTLCFKKRKTKLSCFSNCVTTEICDNSLWNGKD